MSFFHFIARHWREVLAHAGEHLVLVVVAVGAAIAVGLPAGIAVVRRAWLKRPVLAVAGVLQTVPSLALFGFLIPLPFIGGIGGRTAIVALALYALLPIVRNTVTGIEGVDANVREAAEAMGMTRRQVLWQVELPLASGVILAGVRVATVISIGVATIAAAVGAGGLGQYIFRGLRQNDNDLILAGAVPAAVMALVADWLIGLLEARFDARARGGARRSSEKARVARQLAWAIVGVSLVVGGALAARRIVNLSDGDGGAAGAVIRIGSKDFTESVILAEIVAQECEAAGLRVERRFELGGNLCHEALIAGQIDAYPEYTGTALTAILKRPPNTDPRQVYEQVRREYAEQFGVEVGEPLGFSNDFAILVRGDDARRLKLRVISDAVPHARHWRAGFGQDFMSRADGYSGFTRAYALSFAAAPREMDLALTYRALAEGQVDIIAGNSTDGLIAALDLFQLTDDRRYFPPYEAAILTRRAALERSPAFSRLLNELSGAISTAEMRGLNYQVDGEKRDIAEVARGWRSRLK